MFIYQAAKDLPGNTYAEELQQLLTSENLLHYHSCTVSYNYKDTLVIPSKYYREADQAAMLDLVYGKTVDMQLFTETLAPGDAVIAYRIPERVHQVLTNRLSAPEIVNSNTCLIRHASARDLYCIIYNNYIKVVLHKHGQLQLVQLYDYNTPSDVAYHLLNICQQHDLSPSTIRLTLSGFIDLQSNLYAELYRYFLHIEMDEAAEEIVIAEEIKTYPAHYFSSLIALTKCAS